ncbi:M48 family metalloprotease [Streptomyces fradiae]|uniref:M48 family metalloprotease n=1 Tax=Streptomyces fradiae TaxID=1906 RepID=UPI0033CCAB00
MGASVRALRALLLLSGFYLLGIALLAVLAGLDWAAALWAPSSLALKVYVVSALLAVPVVRGMFMLRTPKGEAAHGVPVTGEQEPRLWQEVRELARQVGTRAPDEIRLTGDVNAAVAEEARLLGLLGGTRRLYLGLPLMAGLTEAQLRAVLAHEMGHYGNSDTRLSAITVRGRVQVARTIADFEERAGGKVAKERERQERKNAKKVAKGGKAKEVDTTGAGLTYRAMARLYRAYGHFYLRATLAGSRRQELAADLAAARIAGRDATASALRELPALDSAHRFYLDCYATLGVDAGLLPPPGEVVGGFRHLLAARTGELAELRRDLPDEPSSPYDSHPPIAERVARLEALPDDGRASEPATPALGLLADPGTAMVAVERTTLTPQALRMRRVDWSELVHTAMTGHSAREAEPLRRATAAVAGGDGSLDALLNALDLGVGWEIADRLPKSEEAGAAKGRVAREFARPVLRRGLARMVAGELADRGSARWELSWSRPASLRMPPGLEDELPAALDAAVADRPDTAPLRRLLAA